MGGHRCLAPLLLGSLACAAFFLVPALDNPAITCASPEALPISGKDNPRLASFDRMMREFVTKHKVPGATLAVARKGRLVYARGFGFADVERREAVEANSLMRVASVSKPITAAAVMLLVQQGKLKLTDRVWDLLRNLDKPYPEGRLDPRWKQVTIRELLQHTGGWDRGKSFDPMFRPGVIASALSVPPPASARDVIRYMMGKPLDFDPGQGYAYSNFGYCLAGRVIEAVSGQSYGEFVQRQFLHPIGIRDMRLGKTLASERAPREVKYYFPKDGTGPAVVGPRLGKPVPVPYGTWYLEAMDANGGWIASAPDLVRFAAAHDHPGVLHADSLQALFARPEGKVGINKEGKARDTYYGCGWQVHVMGKGKITTWHTGFLGGTESLLVRRADGLTWAVLFNSSGPGNQRLANLIDPLIHKAADEVRSWPG
jgi:N-acyl-D-amino-acid deacylase